MTRTYNGMRFNDNGTPPSSSRACSMQTIVGAATFLMTLVTCEALDSMIGIVDIYIYNVY